MQYKPLKFPMTFESDTYYYAETEQYDIYPPSDLNDDGKTTVIKDKRCFYEIPVDGTLQCAFAIRNQKNITLDFGGALLVLHGRIQPFLVDNSENITIRNCSVQYSGRFHMEADIQEIGEDFMYLKPKEGFDFRIENGKLIPYSELGENEALDRNTMFMQVFDTLTHDGVGSYLLALSGKTIFPEENPPMEIHQLIAEQANDGFFLRGYHPSDWRSGMSIAFSYEPRDKSSVTLAHSKNCTIENYRILNGAGMGIVAFHTENIHLNGYRLYCDALSQGFITNNADAAHLVACSGEITIENSRFEGMIDDALNIHNNYYLADRMEDDILYARKVSKCLNIENENFC